MPSKPRTLLETVKFRVVEHELTDKSGENKLYRAVVEHPGAVTILPILPDDQVCLIRNNRIAVGKTLIELPAGTIDPNEPPAVTAARGFSGR